MFQVALKIQTEQRMSCLENTFLTFIILRGELYALEPSLCFSHESGKSSLYVGCPGSGLRQRCLGEKLVAESQNARAA